MVIKKARQLLDQMGLSDAYSHRLDTLELQLRHTGLWVTGQRTANLEALIVDVIRNGIETMENRDLTEPVAAMLGQLLRQARAFGTAVPPEANTVFAELCAQVEGGPASLIAMMSVATPSAEDLLAAAKLCLSARYSEDVGYDMLNAAILAERALACDDYITNAVHASFALELLADLGVAMPDWDEAAEPPPAPRRVGEPAEIACGISREGMSVIQAGFDVAGSIVRVTAVDGQLGTPVREPHDVITEGRFRHWATEYPYGYGTDETTTNLFYTTTADLRLSSLPQGPIVVVADVRFQSFPPNLLYCDGDFAGRRRPMAAAPSLAWLEAARRKGMIGDGRLCAWIPTAGHETESGTLSMVAQRLEPSFYQYGVIMDNGPNLPAIFAGASMTVIAAHGGVHPDDGYFQVVSDEGNLRVTARALADALHNVGVVILFVCSGGRTDKHPTANTTLGLAKEILDRGCAAVVASPWPLDSRVPSHWLPAFMHRWFQGDTLIEANFAANQVVDQRFSRDPARGLAMTIFGNPGLRRTVSKDMWERTRSAGPYV